MTLVRHLLEGKSPTLHSIGPDEPVLAAIELMAAHGIGALLVMKGSELVGIVSERDYARKVRPMRITLRDYARKVILMGRSSAETPVWMIMTAPVVHVAPEDSTQTCMLLMTARKFRHLPVVCEGRVVGMLSIGDLVKHLLDEQAREIEQLQRYIAS